MYHLQNWDFAICCSKPIHLNRRSDCIAWKPLKKNPILFSKLEAMKRLRDWVPSKLHTFRWWSDSKHNIYWHSQNLYWHSHRPLLGNLMASTGLCYMYTLTPSRCILAAVSGPLIACTTISRQSQGSIGPLTTNTLTDSLPSSILSAYVAHLFTASLDILLAFSWPPLDLYCMHLAYVTLSQ